MDDRVKSEGERYRKSGVRFSLNTRSQPSESVDRDGDERVICDTS